jgi:2-polyprenyl-3-methyl-5-hydroxy-6-metoxy-1,4-benzoquinol methylase
MTDQTLPANPYTRNPTLIDRLQLLIVSLAKQKRPSFGKQSDQYQEFYEDFFEDKDVEAYYRDPRMSHRRDTINRAISQHLKPGASICDVGCGLGDVLHGLPDGYKLFGMEYAKSCVERAGKRLAGRADIRHGSIYEIPFDSNSMDAALCLEVLEHIEFDRKGARDIARILKPGGFLIAAVPYTYYWPAYMKHLGHFRHYTRQVFGDMLAEAGLKPEAYLVNYPNWHRTYTMRYAMVRAQHMTVGRLFGKKTLYQFKYPWQSKPALDALADSIEPLRQKDAAMDYSKLDTSTFILARKQ